ncbi:MFS transporter [Mycolicibacterium sp.]|uniref:MFS transporter n=1 Tax=Mycolicibacterium sp. TaxID=2320850 RepID=UPI0028A7F7A7|nr:MFS transporter [Mycolicibacterium sp.]
MTAARGSGYDLFGNRLFRNLWGANLIHGLGLVMLLLGASWVMTSLTDNPLLVSMVQTMMSLPFLFFSIPAGVAADTFGHRTVLLFAQAWMLVMTGVLAVVALPGWWDLRPIPLLAVLFLIGSGVVVAQSAWKPFLHDLVPGDKLVAAISLNSLSNRIAQLLGPVLGGYLMGLAGIAVLLFTRAVSHLVMIAALLRIPKSPSGIADSIPSGTDSPRNLRAQVGGSVRDGWRAVTGSPQLYGPLLRCVALMVPVGAVLALLPLEAKENIQTGVIGYGGLLFALGLGTTLGVVSVPVLQRRLRLNALSVVCIVVFALAVLGISQWDSMLLDAIFLLFLGLAWSILSTSHQIAVQIASPPAARGLTTSFYGMALQGSIAVGSFVFGLLSRYVGVSPSILVAGLLALTGLLLVRRYPLPDPAADGSAA